MFFGVAALFYYALLTDFTMFLVCSKIRLYPTPAQETKLRHTLQTCCDVYNALLHWRRVAWETECKSVKRFEQQAALPVWKRKTTADGGLAHPELQDVFSQTLQNVVYRIQLAYESFFRRVARGDKPGFPRPKSLSQYQSFCYPQRGFALNENSVTLTKIGKIKAVVHRRIQGKIKGCTIRVQYGKWYACFDYEIEADILPTAGRAVGIDVGLEAFAALADDAGAEEIIANPRFFRRDEARLARAQRKAVTLRQARNQAQQARLRKARKVVSRVHERIRCRRHDFIHQTTRRLVARYDLLCVEELAVHNMMARPAPKPDGDTGMFLPNGASAKSGLNKSIADAAWSRFRWTLAEKAARAGRRVAEVNPAYTSQRCSHCGDIAPKPLHQRIHHCARCGLRLNRDVNAARNILAVGLHSVPARTG